MIGNLRKHESAVSTGRTSARRLPRAEAKRLVECYLDGALIRELAAEFRIHEDTVKRHLARAGVPTRHRKLRSEDVDEAVKRYEAGESTVEIARSFAVHKDTIGKRLRAAGVVMRSGRYGACPT